ncbi:MAG: long-chain fatty acid--CoA ligase [Proteobacteria bacterium]|nr:long-chain fatty acid--CoA ligase [Pseudomonadota bacterium]
MSEKSIYQEKPWLKFYLDTVPHQVDYKKIFLTDYLAETVKTFPDKMALNFQGYSVTYRELNTMINKMATCYTQLGVQKGDRVAILLPNLIPCVVAYYAALKIGAIVVMNNPLYTDRELEHQFNDSGSKLLVTLDLLCNRMIDLRATTAIKNIIYTSIGDYLPFPKSLLFPLVAKKKKLAADVKPADNVYKWKDILKQYQDVDPQIILGWDDVAMLQYTGGTTGVSKGVMLTHSNLSCQTQQAMSWFPMFKKGEESTMSALPFFHIFGLSTAMNFSIAMGWGNILVAKPQPEQLLETIRKFKPSFAPLVPTMFIGMLAHKDIDKTDLSCIKGCFSGSAPLPIEVIKEFEEKSGSVIAEGFGMTETSPVTHMNPFDPSRRKVGSVGIPAPDTEARIVDLGGTMTDVPVGETGELLIKGPQVMKGYYNNPKATAETFVDGWLRTGDIARMDEDGYFYIVDRIKDMIISGGYNVYPRDIDEVLYEHPKIVEACSIGVPHKHRGEAIKAFVVLKENETATQEEIITFCEKHLAKYKLPTEIEFRKELPKTNVGKILRKDLRQEEMLKHSK